MNKELKTQNFILNSNSCLGKDSLIDTMVDLILKDVICGCGDKICAGKENITIENTVQEVFKANFKNKAYKKRYKI